MKLSHINPAELNTAEPEVQSLLSGLLPGQKHEQLWTEANRSSSKEGKPVPPPPQPAP